MSSQTLDNQYRQTTPWSYEKHQWLRCQQSQSCTWDWVRNVFKISKYRTNFFFLCIYTVHNVIPLHNTEILYIYPGITQSDYSCVKNWVNNLRKQTPSVHFTWIQQKPCLVHVYIFITFILNHQYIYIFILYYLFLLKIFTNQKKLL